MVTSAIVPLNKDSAIEGVKVLAAIVRELREGVFVAGQDYGIIPGTNDKPVLLLPGMEKLMRALRLRAEYVLVTETQDFAKPLFYFRYECRLIDVDSEVCVSTAIGSANSMESKWAWRWVQRHQVPPELDPETLVKRGGRISEFAFAVDKAETTGKYGKPADYWQQFKDAIDSGTATSVMKKTKSGQSQAWEIDSTTYRIPNPDVFDQINTIDKIAQKRALASAIKGAANVSEFFTVDLEDVPQFNVQMSAPVDAIDGEFTEVITEAPAKAAAKKVVAWTPDGLWENLKDSGHFNARIHFDNALKLYTDPNGDEFLLVRDMTLVQAEAAIRFYRSTRKAADLTLFEDAKTQEKFTGACVGLLSDDRAIRAALDAITDYPVKGLAGWYGDKATAWAAVLAASANYDYQSVNFPEKRSDLTYELVRLVCARVIDDAEAEAAPELSNAMRAESDPPFADAVRRDPDAAFQQI